MRQWKHSKRSDNPFIPINCGAITDGLVESELFGAERGAFTDARESRAGIVSQADGGTLMLDEIEVSCSIYSFWLGRFLLCLESLIPFNSFFEHVIQT